MSTWPDINRDIDNAFAQRDGIDPVSDMRKIYLEKLHNKTGRNIIVYYSAWLQNEHIQTGHANGFAVSDNDKTSFMAAIGGMSDKTAGLDLILHTPGGDVAATESLIDYLRSLFGTDVRVIVPQLALSAGTIIALSSKEIMMGKQSSLGPIDPQLFGVAAHGIIEEFERAKQDAEKNVYFANI